MPLRDGADGNSRMIFCEWKILLQKGKIGFNFPFMGNQPYFLLTENDNPFTTMHFSVNIFHNQMSFHLLKIVNICRSACHREYTRPN